MSDAMILMIVITIFLLSNPIVIYAYYSAKSDAELLEFCREKTEKHFRDFEEKKKNGNTDYIIITLHFSF